MPRECGAPAAAPHLSAPSLSTHDTPSRHRSCPHAYPAPAVAAHWSAPSLTAHAGGPAGAPQQEAQQAALLDDDESFTNDEKGRRRRIERSLSQRSLDYLYLMREDAFGFQHCAHEKCLSITSVHSRVPASTRVSTRVAARSRTHPQTAHASCFFSSTRLTRSLTRRRQPFGIGQTAAAFGILAREAHAARRTARLRRAAALRLPLGRPARRTLVRPTIHPTHVVVVRTGAVQATTVDATGLLGPF
jgi:hypothetical protein